MQDGQQFTARIVGRDPPTDVAVLQIPHNGLMALPFGNSRAARVGDFVVAVGNPFSLTGTATMGIISGLARTNVGFRAYESYIQMDAAVNPGNSGGALVNLDGELIGINTTIISPGGGSVGIGFAIPIHIAQPLMEQLIKYGKVRRGHIGIKMQELTADQAKALNAELGSGVLVKTVQDPSPAATAGLKHGDIITAIDERSVRNPADVNNRLALVELGKTVTLDLIARGKKAVVTVPVAEIQLEADRLVPADDLPQLAGLVLGSIEPGSPHFGFLQGAEVLEAAAWQSRRCWRSAQRRCDH